MELLPFVGSFSASLGPKKNPQTKKNTVLPQQDAYTLAANKAVVARLLESLSQGDERAATRQDGIGQLQEQLAAIRSAFPDLAYTLVMQVAEGNLVATRATLRGTHQGALFGFAPSGKAISWDFFSFARVAGNAVVEHSGAADWTAALIQLGLFPGA
jgi:predicted ester cyclase